MAKEKAIIVDLDGTLCNCEHRLRFIKTSPPDWIAFNSHLLHDSLYGWCFELIAAMKSKEYKILIVTGRGEAFRHLTCEWLKKNNIAYDSLFMRKEFDIREDADVKEDLYREFIEKEYDILFVVDDRKSVVHKWRELGLVCLQCVEGNY